MNSEKKRTIPFCKAVRVGNYKVWRNRSGERVDTINISNLDGSWKVCIPSTMTMYSIILTGFEEEDDSRREQFLTMLFGNFLTVTTNSNVYVHDAFACLLEMMRFPYLLLPEKEMEKRMKSGLKDSGMEKGKAKDYIQKMKDKRKQLYDLIENKIQRFVCIYEDDMRIWREKEPDAEKALDQDEFAEQAMDILSEQE